MSRRMKRPPLDYLIVVVLVVLVGWLSWLLLGIVEKEERARTAAQQARAELASLTEREATLRRNLAELETPRGQEASLRETYGVARPGEEVIIVLAPDEGKELAELSWWNRFLGFFGL